MANVSLKNVKKVYPFSGDDIKRNKKKAKQVEKLKKNPEAYAAYLEREAEKAKLQVTEQGVVAVQEFNLEIADKEFIVLVGPSGCGKSTTLRMIAGLEEISGGELYIDDRLVNDVAPKDRDIAMVFQNYALYPHMTVYDNMAFALKLRHTPKDQIDKAVKEAAEILDITQYLGRKPKALSGGQRQRVAIGRAIVREPQVMLMDEPLSNLDAKLRQEMRTELKRLHSDTNSTFVYVTHDQLEAMTLSTQVCLMNNGLLQQYAPPLKIYSTPANLFVAEFVGNPTMNFIPAKVKKLDNSQVTLELLGKEAVFHAQSPVENLGEEAVLGVRPEFLPIQEGGAVEGHVYSTLPSGMETTVKVTCGETMLTSVVFGNVDYPVDMPIRLAINGNGLMLFDKLSGNAVGQGSISF